jgi:hypothetical protein
MESKGQIHGPLSTDILNFPSKQIEVQNDRAISKLD